MSNRGPEVDWARTAEFSTPLRWGEVESEILSRPPPQFEEGEYTGPMTATKVVGAGGAGVIALGALASTAPLVGLLLVVLAVTGASNGAGAGRWTFYVFLTAAVSVMLVILAWAEESRKGSWVRLAMAIVNAVLPQCPSSCCRRVLVSSPEERRAGSSSASRSLA